jgi:hypothetical protein
MSSSSQNVTSLTLDPKFTIDPSIPQSPQASVAEINDAIKAQVDLNKAASTGGSSRRRRRYGSKKGGDPNTIVVAPLPLGADTANAQANNVAAATLFADAVSASKYDSAVTPPKVGGKRRRSTRRLSRKRTKRRSRRSTKYRKMRKGKKSRRTRRR